MQQNEQSTPSGADDRSAILDDREISEAALAAEDFAAQIRRAAARRHESLAGENYEVHPCRRVRGYVLRLPLLGWSFWFPTAAAALEVAARLAGIYWAECRVYDSTGHLESRKTLATLSDRPLPN